MTQDEFVWEHFHELNGMVCDALTVGLHGAPLSQYQQMIRAKITNRLIAMYGQLTAGQIKPEAKPPALHKPANGVTPPNGVPPISQHKRGA